jgi:hypothetical protein
MPNYTRMYFTILDKMFLKRFCLPSTSNIENYETGKNTVKTCTCGNGNYNHIACVIKGKER